MKLSIILLLSIVSLSVSAKSFKSDMVEVSSYDSSIQSPLSKLLILYYDLKNAVVNSDAIAASDKAGSLLKAINGVDTKVLQADERKVFMSLQDKLSYDARHISEVQKIEHQREHFANLSINMYTLAKSVRLSGNPIYEDYCPMKKAYWLSAEAEIKNPYFGNQMPDCGSVKNTLH
ncbi:MAG TPA: DUF3347 domain-containing protein [Puia sp.]|nr:DUF3347 domain-containing protein [Puia sp.]